MNNNISNNSSHQVNSEDYWYLIWEYSTMPMAIFDEDGSYYEANPAFAKLIGYTVEAIISPNFNWKPLFELCMKETLECIEKAKKNLGEEVKLETKIKRRDGSVVKCKSSFVALPKQEDWNKHRFLVCHADITLIKKREDDLNYAINIFGETLEKIIKENDLSVTIDVSELGEDYKQMGENLNHAIETMRNNTQKLEHTTDKLQGLLQELSTPCIKVWEGIIVMPLIGSMTSDRMRDAQANLLREVVNTNSKVAIVDITGVPVMDTMVADGLAKTIKAVKIIGADAIITGVAPEIASTLVNLDVELDAVSKSKLSEGLVIALEILRYKILAKE